MNEYDDNDDDDDNGAAHPHGTEVYVHSKDILSSKCPTHRLSILSPKNLITFTQNGDMVVVTVYTPNTI